MWNPQPAMALLQFSSLFSKPRGVYRVPSGYVKIAIENGPFMDYLPMKHGDFQ